MQFEAFAKPGDSHVLSHDFTRKVTVDGVRITIGLEEGCWVGSSRLGILAGGAGVGSGIYRSPRSFKRATMADLERLIKRIKFSPCKKPSCKGRYLVDDRGPMRSGNPNGFCERHRLSDINTRYKKGAAAHDADLARRDAQKKAQGFRYKATVWLHHNDRSDTYVELYFTRRPTKAALIKAASRRHSKLLGDHTITRL